jgi:thioredoxin:protein disulfide reductase
MQLTIRHMALIALVFSNFSSSSDIISSDTGPTQSSETYTAMSLVASSDSSSLVTQKQTQPSITARISNVITTTSALWLRIIFAFILGLLLSLTPCIYPMIPITVGILQSGSSSSMLRNAIRAGAYACGMATTFACLGLFSAFTGNLFGSLMSSVWVIGAIILLLIYLAGSMIGLYEMYIPRFLQNSSTPAHGGSLFAAFSFGAASGTVASPCLSPGLVLLISLIAKDGNMLAGFLMLFCFGIGLSIPLLVIGTFSSSLTMLPRAGMWMVEIKRLFGFMMLFMCIYLLKPFIPWHVCLWLTAELILGIYIFYLFQYGHTNPFKTIHSQEPTKMSTSFKPLLVVLQACFAICVVFAYRATTQQETCADTFWLHEFDDAKQLALTEQKKILLDVTAPYCTICTAIDTKFFCDKTVVEQCLQTCVPVKINGADTTHEIHTDLQRSLHIIGAPTLVLLDPVTKTELKRWGAELYDSSVEKFVQELKSLV